MKRNIKHELSVLWNQLRKGILQVFSANVINKMVSMLCNMVIVRMLTKETYGIWSYALNIYSYAHLIMGFGLVAGALQFGAENRDQPAENRFYRYCGVTGLLTNIPIVLFFIIGSFVGTPAIPEAGFYLRIYLPILFLEYLIDLLMTILRCKNSFRIYSRLLTLHTVLIAVCICLGSVLGIGGMIAGKYIAAIGSLLAVLYAARTMLPSIRSAGRLDTVQKKALWHYSIFNGINSMLNRLLYVIDLSMIAVLVHSAAELANYKVATLIPNALTFIPGSVMICILSDVIANQRNLPWLKKTIQKTFLCLLLVNILIGVILISFAPIIISIISGKQYLSSVTPFRILTAGYCISGTFRALSVNVLAALKQVKFNVTCSLITCAADVVLNYFLITKIGMIGAAYATFAVECLISLLSFGSLLFVLRKKSADALQERRTCV